MYTNCAAFADLGHWLFAVMQSVAFSAIPSLHTADGSCLFLLLTPLSLPVSPALSLSFQLGIGWLFPLPLLWLYGKKGIYRLSVFWVKLLEKYYLLLVSKVLFRGGIEVDIEQDWRELCKEEQKTCRFKFERSSVLQQWTLISLWIITYLLASCISVLVGIRTWLPSQITAG